MACRCVLTATFPLTAKSVMNSLISASPDELKLSLPVELRKRFSHPIYASSVASGLSALKIKTVQISRLGVSPGFSFRNRGYRQNG